MKLPTLSPSFLVRNRYSYCFRLRVPPDLRPIVKKTELRYSLKTGYLGHAKSQARLMAGLIQKLFTLLREHRNEMKLNSTQVEEIIDVFKMMVLDNYVSNQLAEADRPADIANVFGDILSRVAAIKIDEQSDSAQWISEGLDQILAGMEYTLGRDLDAEQYMELNRRLVKMTLERLSEEKERLKIRHPDIDFGRLFDHQQEAAEGLNEMHPNDDHHDQSESELNILLSELIQKHIEQNLRANNWRPRTIPEYKSIFKGILRLIGDCPLYEIDKKKCREFKENLMGLPKDFFRAKKKYNGIPVRKITSEAKPPLLNVKTINKYLEKLKQLLEYAQYEYELPSNPGAGLRIKVKSKKAYEERDILSAEDLKLIFHSEEYVKDQLKPPWKFWLPLLALYTGARLEELCQMELEDIECVDGIWIMNITGATNGENVEEKQVKTKAAERIVPLHPFLVEDLNFPGHIESLKVKKKKRVFPELTKQSERWGHYPSRWFGTFKKSLGINSKKKTFHSFRHSFQDNLKQQLVPVSVVDELAGHVLQGESYGRYGKPFLAKVRYEEAILKLDYGIDLTHLKDSRWVVK